MVERQGVQSGAGVRLRFVRYLPRVAALFALYGPFCGFLPVSRTAGDLCRCCLGRLASDLNRQVQPEPLQVEDILSPLWTMTARNDPTIDALLSAEVSICPPQRSYTSGGKRVEWTPQQYDALQVLTGQAAKPALDALTQFGDWLAMGDDERKDAVRDVLADARKEAKASVLSGAVPAAGGPWSSY